MTLRKIERDQQAAELTAVNAIIDRLTDDDFLTRISLESRRNELQAWLAEQAAEPEETTASAALFFSGNPVAQTRGILAEFGAQAVSTFQDLVAKVMAQEGGPLAVSGPVPNKGAAALHITNVTRGSFGFLLEEIEPQGQALETPLKLAVDNATRLLTALGDADENRFREVVETVDQRALNTAQEFFALMRNNGARFRLVAGEAEQSFTDDAIVLATERASTTLIDTTEDQVEGILDGALPEAHLFEFRSDELQETVSGSVTRAISASEIANWLHNLVGRAVIATLKVRRVTRNDVVVRKSFTLLRLEPKPETSRPTVSVGTE